MAAGQTPAEEQGAVHLMLWESEHGASMAASDVAERLGTAYQKARAIQLWASVRDTDGGLRNSLRWAVACGGMHLWSDGCMR